jgi:hypothetical protein
MLSRRKQPQQATGKSGAAGARRGKADADDKPAYQEVPLTTTQGLKRSAMEAEFDKLRQKDRFDEGVDAIGPEGMKIMARDFLQLPNDAPLVAHWGVEMFTVGWKLQAVQAYTVTRAEWLSAMSGGRATAMATSGAAGFGGPAAPVFQERGNRKVINDWASLREKVSMWVEEVNTNEKAFQQMYNHTYDFIRGDDEKLLPQAKAMKAWRTLLAGDTRHHRPTSDGLTAFTLSNTPGCRFPLLPLFERWLQHKFVRRTLRVPGDSRRRVAKESSSPLAPGTTSVPATTTGSGSPEASSSSTTSAPPAAGAAKASQLSTAPASGEAAAGDDDDGDDDGWITEPRAITRDMWQQVLVFSRKVKDVEDYHRTDGWPSAFDDFIAWTIGMQERALAAMSAAKLAVVAAPKSS